MESSFLPYFGYVVILILHYKRNAVKKQEIETIYYKNVRNFPAQMMAHMDLEEEIYYNLKKSAIHNRRVRFADG